MKKHSTFLNYFLIGITILLSGSVVLGGNLAREFNVYAPPQTDYEARISFVSVTAVVGNNLVTEVDIIDRDDDGDTDDTYENLTLTQGQSYIVYHYCPVKIALIAGQGFWPA